MVIDMSYWTRVTRNILYVILIIIAIYFLFKFAVFYLPFLIAFIISLIIEPIIKFLIKKFKFTRKTSSIIVFFVVSAIILGSLTWGIMTLISEATNLMQGLNNYYDKAYKHSQNIINKFDFNKINVSDELINIFHNSANDILQTISNWLKSFLTNVLNWITSIPTIAVYFIITILSLYFICVDKIYILDQIEHHMPKLWVKKIGLHLKQITNTLSNYLKAQVTIVVISFAISLIGLYILKLFKFNIQYPLLMALAIGFVDALPILGSGTVMVPWAICSSLDGDFKLGIAIVILWIIMSIVRQIIEPRIISKQIGIHPIFTLIAMYTGFKLLGVFGMLIRSYSINYI